MPCTRTAPATFCARLCGIRSRARLPPGYTNRYAMNGTNLNTRYLPAKPTAASSSAGTLVVDRRAPEAGTLLPCAQGGPLPCTVPVKAVCNATCATFAWSRLSDDTRLQTASLTVTALARDGVCCSPGGVGGVGLGVGVGGRVAAKGSLAARLACSCTRPVCAALACDPVPTPPHLHPRVGGALSSALPACSGSVLGTAPKSAPYAIPTDAPGGLYVACFSTLAAGARVRGALMAVDAAGNSASSTSPDLVMDGTGPVDSGVAVVNGLDTRIHVAVNSQANSASVSCLGQRYVATCCV